MSGKEENVFLEMDADAAQKEAPPAEGENVFLELDAAAAQAPPAEEEGENVFLELDAEENAADERVRTVQKLALDTSVEDHITIEQIAQKTGLEQSAVLADLPNLRKAMASADFDARTWRQQNRHLEKMWQKHPGVAGVSMQDEKISPVTKWLRQAGVWGGHALKVAAQYAPPGAASVEEMQRGGQEVQADVEAGRIKKPAPLTAEQLNVVRQVSTEKSPLAEAEGVERLGMYVDSYSRNRKQDEIAQKFSAALVAGERGDVEEETRLIAEANDLKKALVAQDYNQSTAEQIALDSVAVGASVAGTIKSAGVGGLIGATAAGGLGFLIGGPAGAALGAEKGLVAGAGFGAYGYSYEMALGGAFDSFLNVHTDEGKPLSRDIARKGAQLYAISAPLLEVKGLAAATKGMMPKGLAVLLEAPKEAIAEALKKETFRQLVTRIAKGNLSEAGTESLEELTSQVIGYFSRSYEAGELQQPDIAGGLEETLGAAGPALGGLLLPGLASVASNMAINHVTQRRQEARQARSESTVEAIGEAATTPTARASPAAMASLVEAETGTQTVQVTPTALARYFQTQANPEAAATAMLGEGAQETLQTALATGDRLEVSATAVLALGDDAKALVPEMATNSDVDTQRERLEKAAARQAAETEAQARSLVEAHAAPEVALSETEKRLDALQDSLADTQHYTAAEAREALETWRALTRTQAARMGKSMDELFSGALFAVEDDNGTPTMVLTPAVTARYTKEGATVTTAGTGAVEQLGEVLIEAKEGARTYRIKLRPGANRSTFLHETGHVVLELMGDLAAREDAPPKLKADYAALLGKLGVSSREELTGTHHEAFAEMTEGYFREGLAPSEALQGTFSRYREWLHKVYPALPPVHAQLSQEVRELMERLYATDEEIAAASTASGYKPTLRTAESAQLPPAEFAALQDSFAQAEDAARRALETQVREAQALEADERWQKEKAQEETAAGLEYDVRPDVRAADFLTTGRQVLLDEGGKAHVVPTEGTVGLERKATLRMLRTLGVKQVPARLQAMVRTKADAATRAVVHPDVVADMFGFESGVAMLQALRTTPKKEAFVRQLSDARMAEKHPSLLNDRAALREAAQAALHAEGTTQPLLREWETMRQALPEGAPKLPPLAAVRRAATLMAERTRVRHLEARRAQVAEKRASEAAALAWARGDVVGANQAKMQQVLNHLLFRELKKAEGEKAAFRKALSSATRDATLRKLGKGGLHFRRLVEALTGALEGLSTQTESEKRQQAAQRTDALNDFLEATAAEDIAPAFDRQAIGAILANPTPWQSLTLADMREAQALLAQAEKLAEDAHTMHLQQQAMSLDDFGNAVMDDTKGQRQALAMPKDKTQRKWWQKFVYKLAWQGQSWRDPEEQLRHLGPNAHTFFIRGLLETRKVKHELAREVGAFFAEKWKQLPEALRERRYEVVDTSALPMPSFLAQGGPFSRQWAWMVALNFGNEATRQHLLQGYGWTEKQVTDFIGSTLEKDELDFLQGVWDMLDTKLEPRMAAHYESVNGVRPKAPTATPIVTPHGVYRGGFFPMKDDPDPNAQAYAKAFTDKQQEAAASNAAQGLRSFKPPRGKGAEVRLPNLSWEVMPAHVGRTIHYLATDKFVREMKRVMMHPTFVDAVVKRRGLVGYEFLQAFVRVVETDQPDTKPSDLSAFHTWAKGQLTKAALAFNLANVAADFLGPIVVATAGKLSPVWMGLVYGKAVGGLIPPVGPLRVARKKGWTVPRQRALEKSTEMQMRKESMTDSLRKALSHVGEAGNKSKTAQLAQSADEGLFILQACSDAVSSTVVWEARYQQALADGLSDEAAVQAADDVIRETFPSNDIALQPYALREKAITGSVLAMFSYMAKIGNVKVGLVQGPLESLLMAEGWGEITKRTSLLALSYAQVMLVNIVAKSLPDIIAGRGREEDETQTEWWLRSLATADVSGVPYVGWALEPAAKVATDVALGRELKLPRVSARASPASASLERVWRAIGVLADSGKGADDKVMAMVGVLNAQAGKSGRYVLKAAQGEAPSEPGDIFLGLLYGPPR